MFAFQFCFSQCRLRVLYIENGQQKMIGTLPEIQHSEEISHLIIQSGVDVNGGQTKKTIERHSSLMPTSREFKGKVMSAESREKGRIIKREEKRKGLVEFRTYFTYMVRGGLLLFAFVLFCQLATVALNVYSSFWLSQWASATSGTIDLSFDDFVCLFGIDDCVVCFSFSHLCSECDEQL